jgi:superfamily I DNA/RNA helicase
MANRLIGAVGKKQVPSGQYMAVLIDEGHDFEPEWLTLATQMVDPETNCLLAMFDGAQSVHDRARVQAFSFKRVGIQAQGHTTVLRVNYRNTRQILHAASLLAGDLLINADENGQNEDAIQLIAPVSCGRDGPEPVVLQLPSLRCAAMKICELLCAAHEEGHAWRDMAVLSAEHPTLDDAARVMAERMLPHQVCREAGMFDSERDTVNVMAMEAGRGLEFEVVAVLEPDLDQNNSTGQMRYVAATRCLQRMFTIKL